MKKILGLLLVASMLMTGIWAMEATDPIQSESEIKAVKLLKKLDTFSKDLASYAMEKKEEIISKKDKLEYVRKGKKLRKRYQNPYTLSATRLLKKFFRAYDDSEVFLSKLAGIEVDKFDKKTIAKIIINKLDDEIKASPEIEKTKNMVEIAVKLHVIEDLLILEEFKEIIADLMKYSGKIEYEINKKNKEIIKRINRIMGFDASDLKKMVEQVKEQVKKFLDQIKTALEEEKITTDNASKDLKKIFKKTYVILAESFKYDKDLLKDFKDEYQVEDGDLHKAIRMEITKEKLSVKSAAVYIVIMLLFEKAVPGFMEADDYKKENKNVMKQLKHIHTTYSAQSGLDLLKGFEKVADDLKAITIPDFSPGGSIKLGLRERFGKQPMPYKVAGFTVVAAIAGLVAYGVYKFTKKYETVLYKWMPFKLSDSAVETEVDRIIKIRNESGEEAVNQAFSDLKNNYSKVNVDKIKTKYDERKAEVSQEVLVEKVAPIV